MSDNGNSDDRKRRQDFSSMYHGILLIHRPVADVASTETEHGVDARIEFKPEGHATVTVIIRVNW